jgi:thymidylate synthase (FAD)
LSDRTDPSDKVERVRVNALDAILGVTLRVLDDGFVRVVDYMGGDTAIVQAARVSYGAGTKRISEDRGLIRYLMRHRHTTPFEMCEIKLHVRVPMDCWRQWIRHRTASVNEYSTRYSLAIDAAKSTSEGKWRRQSTQNRQGSEEAIDADTGTRLSRRERDLQRLAREVYDERIAAGVAREQARKDLPISTYTEAYWKVNLHNLFHFLALRMDVHAQDEIREYATLIGRQVVSVWCPLAWEAFVDYELESMHLSKLERQIVVLLSTGNSEKAIYELETRGLLSAAGKPIKPNRERSELEAKLRSLSMQIPWLA